jgi:hypothetical protein
MRPHRIPHRSLRFRPSCRDNRQIPLPGGRYCAPSKANMAPRSGAAPGYLMCRDGDGCRQVSRRRSAMSAKSDDGHIWSSVPETRSPRVFSTAIVARSTACALHPRRYDHDRPPGSVFPCGGGFLFDYPRARSEQAGLLRSAIANTRLAPPGRGVRRQLGSGVVNGLEGRVGGNGITCRDPPVGDKQYHARDGSSERFRQLTPDPYVRSPKER